MMVSWGSSVNIFMYSFFISSRIPGFRITVHSHMLPNTRFNSQSMTPGIIYNNAYALLSSVAPPSMVITIARPGAGA